MSDTFLNINSLVTDLIPNIAITITGIAWIIGVGVVFLRKL